METWVSSVCDVIRGPRGTDFLEVMRRIYAADGLAAIPAAATRALADQGVGLGVLVPRGEGFVLSGPGYLLGNVAKEYCNWLDHGRRMPPPRPPEEFIRNKDVLDLGCSIGRWLWEFQATARSVTGIELRPEYIELGRALAQRENIPPPQILTGSIERVDEHVPPQSMDFVFCRLAINHVAIRKVLDNVVEVLRPGGVVWLEAESFKCGWQKLRQARGVRGIAYTAFGIANSLVCTATGRQITVSCRGRHQTAHKVAYPSRGWWFATFRRCGLTPTVLDANNGPFCIWGRKP